MKNNSLLDRVRKLQTCIRSIDRSVHIYHNNTRIERSLRLNKELISIVKQCNKTMNQIIILLETSKPDWWALSLIWIWLQIFILLVEFLSKMLFQLLVLQRTLVTRTNSKSWKTSTWFQIMIKVKTNLSMHLSRVM